MAKLQTEHQFEGSQQEVFAAICQYKRYPDYLPGVTGISVLPAKEKNSVCQVRYELRIIKEFFYILNMFETAPDKIWWNLADSNIMTFNEGAWTFKKSGPHHTNATYSLEVKLKGLIPRVITDKIAEANLPGMMQGFQKLVLDSRQ